MQLVPPRPDCYDAQASAIPRRAALGISSEQHPGMALRPGLVNLVGGSLVVQAGGDRIALVGDTHLFVRGPGQENIWLSLEESQRLITIADGVGVWGLLLRRRALHLFPPTGQVVSDLLSARSDGICSRNNSLIPTPLASE